LNEEQRDYIDKCLSVEAVNEINRAFGNFFTELDLMGEGTEHNELFEARPVEEIEQHYLPRFREEVINELNNL